jgi:hypothetical protein
VPRSVARLQLDPVRAQFVRRRHLHHHLSFISYNPSPSV